MAGSIRLHPKLGVNPKLTYCPRCGGESNELILIGANDGIYKCKFCGIKHYGNNKGNKCGKCGQPQSLERVGEIGEHEKLPASQPCDSCKKEVEEHKAVVAAGGVYFKCKDCGANGVVKPDVPIAAEVRKKLGIEPPAPCGLELDKDSCQKCKNTTGDWHDHLSSL